MLTEQQRQKLAGAAQELDAATNHFSDVLHEHFSIEDLSAVSTEAIQVMLRLANKVIALHTAVDEVCEFLDTEVQKQVSHVAH